MEIVTMNEKNEIICSQNVGKKTIDLLVQDYLDEFKQTSRNNKAIQNEIQTATDTKVR